MLSSGMDTLVPQSTDAFDHAAHSGMEHKSSAGELLYFNPNLLKNISKLLNLWLHCMSLFATPLNQVGTVATVEDFWQLHQLIKPPSCLALANDYAMFRQVTLRLHLFSLSLL